MSCSTCSQNSGIVYDDPSIMGRNITGRSEPGYDIRKTGQYPVQMQTGSFAPQPKKLINFDWGTFVIGFVVGGIVVGLLVTQTGRGLLGAAGERTTRYVRGR